MSESKEIVLAGSNYSLMNFDKEMLKEIIADNLGGNGGLQINDLDRVKIPSGGNTTWEVPSASGMEETKTLSGIIVSWKETRGYWEKPMEETGGGTPPDCQSDDTIFGYGTPGGACETCPLAQFGSGKGGEGQACKLVRHLFMIRENGILPLVVGVAPGSNKQLRQYFMRLASEGIPYYGVVTELTLEKEKSKGGITYAQIRAKNTGKLDPENFEKIKNFRSFLLPALEKIKIEQTQE